jgi:hypothetical protein
MGGFKRHSRVGSEVAIAKKASVHFECHVHSALASIARDNRRRFALHRSAGPSPANVLKQGLPSTP